MPLKFMKMISLTLNQLNQSENIKLDDINKKVLRFLFYKRGYEKYVEKWIVYKPWCKST